MARLYNTYEFIGDLVVPKDKDKFIAVTESTDYKNYRLNFGIKESNTNSVFVEMFGSMKKDGNGKVFTFGKSTDTEKGSKLEIPWANRLDAGMIDKVADFKRYRLDLTEDKDIKNELYKLAYEIRTLEYKTERTDAENEKLKTDKSKYTELAKDVHEFIAEFDMIQYIVQNIENLKDKKFKVKGSIDMNEWKGKFYKKFKVESMELMPSDAKNQFKGLIDIFFNNDCVDDRDFETDKKVYVDGFIQSYDSKVKKDLFYPQQFVINASRLDITDPETIKRVNFLKKWFNAKDDEVRHLQWEVSIFRGAEKVELTLEDLTDEQREMVEMNIKTLEDYSKKQMLGKNKDEIRLLAPVIMGEMDKGSLLTDLTPEELIYTTTADENINDIKKDTPKVEDEKVLEEDKEEMFKDLFS